MATFMILFVLALSLVSSIANAQSPIPLFQTQAPVEVEIVAEFPIAKVQTAKIKLAGKDLEMQIDVRGYYRKQVCKFPPLKLTTNANTKLAGTILAGMQDDELKVVTHCEGQGNITPTSDRGRAVFEEFVLYRVLNVTGFPNFKARLARITYRLPNGRIFARAPGFFIEPKKDAAKRVGLKSIKRSEINFKNKVEVDAFILARNLLLMNLVASYDHDLEWNANSLLLRKPEDAKVLKASEALLYDFDLSRLVRGHDEYQNEINDEEFQAMFSLAITYQENPEVKQKAIDAARKIIEREAAIRAVIRTVPNVDLVLVNRHFDNYFRLLKKFAL